MKGLKFQFGDWVRFTRVVTFGHEREYVVEHDPVFHTMERRVWRAKRRKMEIDTLSEAKIGRICGFTIRHEGPIDPGYQDSDGEGPSLTVEKSHRIWQVKTGLRNKPYEVLEEDLTAFTSPELINKPFNIPTVDANLSWSECTRTASPRSKNMEA